MFLRPKGSNKVPKVVQNDPTWAKHSKYHGWKQCQRNWKKQKRKVAGQPPQRPACGGCHGWTVAVATAMVADCSIFPFAAVRFPAVLCVLLSFCSDKSSIILSYGHTSIISSTIDHLVLVLVWIREKEGEVKIARIPCRICERKTQALFWLSIFFPSLLFSHFRFIFCNFDLNLWY